MFQSFENGISTFLSFHKMLCNCLRSCGPCDPSLGSPQHRYDISCKPQFRQFFPFFFFSFFFFFRFDPFCSVFFAPLLSLSSSASFSCIFLFSIYPILSSLSFCLLVLSSLFFYSSNMFCSSCMLSIDLFFLLLFLFFFCQLYPGPRNCKSVFLILKILQYDG